MIPLTTSDDDRVHRISVRSNVSYISPKIRMMRFYLMVICICFRLRTVKLTLWVGFIVVKVLPPDNGFLSSQALGH